jgi:hypothetical protein
VRGGWIVLAKVEGIVGEVNSSDIVIIATDLTESNFVLLDTNTGYLKNLLISFESKIAGMTLFFP